MGGSLKPKETKEKSDDEDPLTKLTEADRAWLAGLFQAEADFAKDLRVHSKLKSPDYTPPPPKPFVKLDMVEEDLMLHVGNLLGEKVKTLNKPTKANKKVYRIEISSRQRVDRFLKTILPYVYGELKRGKILDLLKECENHRTWVAEGGRSKAASHAASFSNASPSRKSNKDT